MAESIKSIFKPKKPKKYKGDITNIICRSSWERRFCNWCDINENIIVSSYHPGWVRTDMGGVNADISTEESATGLVKHFLNLQQSDSGKFFNYDGKPLPL